MNNRRKLIVALGSGALTVPFGSLAQQQGKVWRIGFLGPGTASNTATRLEALRAGLRELGYAEGKNIVIDYRWADGKPDRLPALAVELVRLNVDVIVTHGSIGPLAAKQATTTIPTVMAVGGDPVAAGIVASLARPGGNITGATFFSADLSAKRIELLKEALPRVTQVAALVTPPDNTDFKPTLQTMELTAELLKVKLPRFVVRGPKEFEGAFAAMIKQRAGGVVIPEFLQLNIHANEIAELALKHHLPLAGNSEFAEAGGLIGYGANIIEMFRRAAYFIDKILKGTKPADLPIEQATKFDLVVNMKTAKALGIKIPDSIMLRADKVIE
jgi:putative ABC transport system substrate-binding protein